MKSTLAKTIASICVTAIVSSYASAVGVIVEDTGPAGLNGETSHEAWGGVVYQQTEYGYTDTKSKVDANWDETASVSYQSIGEVNSNVSFDTNVPLNTATFQHSFSMWSQSAPVEAASGGVYSEFFFTLTEAASFNILGSFSGGSDGLVSAGLSILLAKIGPAYEEIYSEYLYDDTSLFDSFDLELDDSSITAFGSPTGVLEAGTYYLETSADVYTEDSSIPANARGSISFVLSAPPSANVPDASSTLALLAAGLAGIGLMNRRKQK